jgi:phosphatidylglycerophosphate synthase
VSRRVGLSRIDWQEASMSDSPAHVLITAPFRDAIRIQKGVLTSLERRTLIWLATRLPASIHSDHLTLLALIAMIGVGSSYWLARTSPFGLVLATICLAVNWFGDSLDGTIARLRHQERPRYGYYVDHVVDAVGTLSLFIGLAASGYMAPEIAAAALIAYFITVIETYLAAHSLGRFEMSVLGIGPTELRVLLGIGNLALLTHPTSTVFGREFRLFDIGGAVAAAALMVVFAWSTVRHTRALSRAEPRPVGRVNSKR